MSPKSRHLISTGVLFSALAFAGASYAQSSGTAPDSARAASESSTHSQSASSGTASPNTSGNRSGDTTAGSSGSTTSPSASSGTAESASTSQSTTATPPASAAAQSSGSQASGSTAASDRADTQRTQASGSTADRSDTQRSQASASSDADRASSAAGASSQGHMLRASKVIGADVENANGDDIGEIKDMVVDTQSESVRYVVLSHGGILGIGDKLFAYPMSKVQSTRGDDDKFVMNVDKEQLENAPGFDNDQWPDFADAKYTSEIDRYYGADRAARGDDGKPAHVVRASELIGRNFEDRQGNKAGEIDDLIVDSATGRVAYAIADLDDDWNKQADGKLVAIPLKEFAMSGEDRDKLVIQSSGDSIDTSRSFAENQWPELDDPMWRTSGASSSVTSPRSDASGALGERSDVASNMATQRDDASASAPSRGTTASGATQGNTR